MPLYPNEVPRQDGPDWDDEALGWLAEAREAVDRGNARLALRNARWAVEVLERHLEDA